MASDKTFRAGMTAGIFVMLAAQSVHWMMAPMSHQDASSWREVAVVAPGVVSILIVLWLMARQHRRQARTTAR